MDQTWNYQIPTDGGVNYIENFFTDINYNREWAKLSSSYKLGSFFFGAVEKPIIGEMASEFLVDYYNEFAKLPIWPLAQIIIAESVAPDESEKAKDSSLRQALVPQGSLRDRVVNKILPKDSERRRKLRNLYHKIVG